MELMIYQHNIEKTAVGIAVAIGGNLKFKLKRPFTNEKNKKKESKTRQVLRLAVKVNGWFFNKSAPCETLILFECFSVYIYVIDDIVLG